MRPTYPTHISLIIGLILSFTKLSAQNKLLKLDRINFSSNTITKSIDAPPYREFTQDFRFGRSMSVQSEDTFTENEIETGGGYSGLNINFVFKSNLFDSLKFDRRFFTFSAEAGLINNKLYELITDNNRQFRINYRAEVFRLAIGYRHILTKKDRRVKFYTGIELVNEFNISSTIRENEYDEGFNEQIAQRKFFATKGFGFYINAPIGLDWKPSKKTRYFIHINMGIGSQNADPFRIKGGFSGLRLGVSFKV